MSSNLNFDYSNSFKWESVNRASVDITIKTMIKLVRKHNYYCLIQIEENHVLSNSHYHRKLTFVKSVKQKIQIDFKQEHC